jgi:hypothetical protein
MAADTPVTQISELFMTTEGLLAVLGALSTTVLPDDVDTVLELLLTVLETVDEVTVSVALAGLANRTNANMLSVSSSIFFETTIASPSWSRIA